MNSEPSGQSLKSSWRVFARAVAHPSSMVFLLLACGVVFAALFVADAFIQTLMLAILALVTAVLGGIWTNRWIQETEQRAVEIRGRSAIRSLGLLRNNVTRLEKRIREHEATFCAEQKSQKALREALRGTVEMCRSIDEEVINAIEHWADVVPEADVRAQLNSVTGILEEKRALEERISNLQQKQESEKRTSAQERQRLAEQLEDTKSELSKLSKELSEKKRKLPTALNPESYATSRYSFSDLISHRSCLKCHELYKKRGILDNGLCQVCDDNTGFLPSLKK